MTDATKSDALVVFTPSGKRGRFPLGTPILQAARSLGVDIDSVCGGRAICGRCQITVGEGDFAKHGITSRATHLSEFSAVEQRYDEKRGLTPGRRLSCQTLLRGDVVIDVPPESQVHKQVVRKRAEARLIDVHPVTRLYYLEVEEPDMHKPSSDLERVYRALSEQWQIDGVSCGLDILRELQPLLRKGDVEDHRCRPFPPARWGEGDNGHLARFPRPRPGPRRRCRLDDHRRPFDRPVDRRCRSICRAHESPDPLRRRPHEQGVLRHDESRRR